MTGREPNAAAVSVAHVDAETGFSGGEVQVFLLMEGLRERGHRCVLVAPPGSRGAARGRERGFEVVEVPMRNDFDLPAVLRIARALRASGVDLVHGHTGRATWLGALAARRAGIPAVSTRRMDREVKRNARNRWLYGSLLARVAAIAPAVERCLHAGGVPEDKVELVWSTVDPARLVARRTRAEVRGELRLSESTPLILAVGALHARKGFDLLLTAYARLRAETGAQLRIAGEGPERDALERLAREHQLDPDALLLGARDDVPDLLAAADVFAMPSRREGLGIAALEAMGHGCALVASGVGGLGEAVVDGVTGLLVPPDDAGALADALERLLADADLRARLGSAGPARIDAHFRPERMVAAYEELYARVLRTGNPAAEVAGGSGR